MNNAAQQYRVRPCIVCGFPFSDEHHIHPEILGRENSPVIILCPNHHRYAHIAQNMARSGQSYKQVEKFARQCFDKDFNEIALPLIISNYMELLMKGLDKCADYLTSEQVATILKALIPRLGDVGFEKVMKSHFAKLSVAELEELLVVNERILRERGIDPDAE